MDRGFELHRGEYFCVRPLNPPPDTDPKYDFDDGHRYVVGVYKYGADPSLEDIRLARVSHAWKKVVQEYEVETRPGWTETRPRISALALRWLSRNVWGARMPMWNTHRPYADDEPWPVSTVELKLYFRRRKDARAFVARFSPKTRSSRKL